MSLSLSKLSTGAALAAVFAVGLLASNETATAAKPVFGPDLVVTSFKAAGQPKVQGKEIWIPVHVEIRNQGKRAAKGKFAVAIKRLGTWRWVKLTETLGRGQSRKMQGIVKIPKRRFGRKMTKLVVMVDAPIAAGDTSLPKTGRVKESNEANNTKTLSVKLP